MWSADGVEVSFHRIALAAWAGDAVLRSWAEAPWQATPSGVAVACLPGEAVWLGLGTDGAPASVTLSDCHSGDAAQLQLPSDWQLAAVGDPEGRKRPLALGERASRRYRLGVRTHAAPAGVSFELELMSPSAWAGSFGPLDLAPAEAPPPVLAYSRIVRSRPHPGGR